MAIKLNVGINEKMAKQKMLPARLKYFMLLAIFDDKAVDSVGLNGCLSAQQAVSQSARQPDQHKKNNFKPNYSFFT